MEDINLTIEDKGKGRLFEFKGRINLSEDGTRYFSNICMASGEGSIGSFYIMMFTMVFILKFRHFVGELESKTQGVTKM